MEEILPSLCWRAKGDLFQMLSSCKLHQMADSDHCYPRLEDIAGSERHPLAFSEGCKLCSRPLHIS